ncbi:hypothetical protein [Polaromonas sp. C04]|uniref:hypothetical protein n=1 Tax=Polaromonas sp. C04 TaxID=1945857 RepID=UPI0011860EB1|nr:hypothetical protein [Polaromonas sp. C04]
MNPNGQRADVTMCQNHRPARRMHRAGDKRIVRALPPLFPLLRTTTRVVFLDDDVRYLQMLSIAIPERFAASLYSAGVEAANDLQASLAHLARERSGLAGIAADGEKSVVLALRYLHDPSRFFIAGVLGCDYAMPDEAGTAFCAKHAISGLRRILLTGSADTEVAVGAFNEGAIELYMPKQASNPLEKLIVNVDSQMLRSAAERGAVLAAAIPPQTQSLLEDRQLEPALTRFIEKLGVVEYVFLGRPLGLIAVDKNGSVLWIQLEDEPSLRGLVEILTESGWNREEIDLVRDRKAAVDVEVASQLPGHEPRIEPLQQLCAAPYLGAAVFALDALPDALAPAQHRSWRIENAGARLK